VKPAPFVYHRPGSLDEALALLAEHGDEARPLAGGQSLVPAMNFRLAQPARLIDLNAIATLAYVRDAPGGGLRLGAMARQRTVERDARVALRAPLLALALPFIAHPQIRNRGTIGGSLAHNDPAAELPAVMVTLEAQVELSGHGGQRSVPACEFFQGLFATALSAGELLTGIVLPPPGERTGFAFEEVARRHGDFALAGVAAMVGMDARGAGTCDRARVTLFSVGEGPVSAQHAAEALVGRAPDEAVVREAARVAAARDVDPPGDLHATTAYRRRLVEVLVRRALSRAIAEARREMREADA
jgi:carbon-monoxide dehydrogenase medium subunit